MSGGAAAQRMGVIGVELRQPGSAARDLGRSRLGFTEERCTLRGRRSWPAEGHRFAPSPGVPVAALAEEPLLLAEEQRAPEFNQFVIELCRSVGFLPAVYRGTVESIRGAVDLVAQGRTVLCAPASCVPAHPGVVWRPLTEPVSRYPWSVLWRAADHSKQVRAMVSCARELSRELGWLEPSGQAAG